MMKISLRTLVILMTLLACSNSSRKKSKKGKLSAISCSKRNQLIGIGEQDRVVSVERLPMSRIVLTCNYCGDRDGGDAKSWFKTEDLWNVDVNGKEIKTDERVNMQRDHSLVIDKFTVNDTGMYYCYDKYHHDKAHKFLYTVDMLFPQAVPPVEGWTKSDLREYTHKYIEETTKFQLRTYWRFKDIELYLSWAPWSTCHGCKGQPGTMYRMGTLRQRHHDYENAELKNNRGGTSISYKTGLSARSMHIFLHEKQLSLTLRALPDYLEKRNCSNPRRCKSKKSASDSLRERSFLARLGPAPRKRFTAGVFEQDPAILECPWPPEKTIRQKLRRMVSDSTVGKMMGIKMNRPKDRDITWYFYNKVLKKSIFEESGHRIRISRDGRLMFGSVRKTDRGRYSCAEDGIEIAVIQLKIKPTFTLEQSYTSFRVLGVSFILDLSIFIFFMVVLYRQRRVQRLLAGARWRHEQRQDIRRRKGRKQRFILQQKRALQAQKDEMELAGIKIEEVLHLVEDTLHKEEIAEGEGEEGEEGEEDYGDMEADDEDDDGEDVDYEEEGGVEEGDEDELTIV